MMLLAALLAASLGDLQITNFEAGAEVRYPVVLLRGTTASQEVAVGLTWKAMTHYPVAAGKFVAPVELKPGINMLLLTSGADILKLRIDYRPMTTPYHVICAYIAPPDDSTNYDAPPGEDPTLYGEKLDTALKLLQSFTAESMNDAGYGRKTFSLELGPKGHVVVHVIRASQSMTGLRSMTQPDLFAAFQNQLLSRFPPETQKTCAFLSFSRYDRSSKKLLAQCHQSDKSLVILDSSGFALWPSSVREAPTYFADASNLDRRFFPDETATREVNWALTSTTLGEVLQELGHTFGLADSQDPFSVMSGGSDQINRAFTVFEPPSRLHDRNYYFKPDETPHWDSASASALNRSPWFQPDGAAGP